MSCERLSCEGCGFDIGENTLKIKHCFIYFNSDRMHYLCKKCHEKWCKIANKIDRSQDDNEWLAEAKIFLRPINIKEKVLLT